MSDNRTRIQRNPTTMLVRGGLALGAELIALWMFFTWPSGIGTWVLGGIFLLLGMGLTYWTFSSSAEARCPGCGLAIRGLASDHNEPRLCKSCVEFVEGQNGELWLCAPDRVADSTRFAAPAPENAVFPTVCAVCGAASTRQVTASWEEKTDAPLGTDLATRAASLGTMKAVTVITHSVKVPHCGEHDDGARLRPSFGGGGSDVVFRSLAYHRAYCKANKLTAVP